MDKAAGWGPSTTHHGSEWFGEASFEPHPVAKAYRRNDGGGSRMRGRRVMTGDDGHWILPVKQPEQQGGREEGGQAGAPPPPSLQGLAWQSRGGT